MRPIGSNKEIQVDVRLVSATNENLEQAIEKGTSVSYTHLDVYKRQRLCSAIRQLTAVSVESFGVSVVSASITCIWVLLNSTSVSYTHLDVYKRQTPSCL